MKLKKIKLSGFKSFVDPTIVELQSNLTGVVGPNGCGKSNIIDAIRWVMGEISAKQLRGASMHDVIFNGSSARKPVGKAIAELVFDNSDASLGGEYANYNEISIRREVNQDGFSDYFLNNVSCRRKDVTNIFLGTGLGANSYALIGQGMISQFIEAKPDDLRVFIEEAAGISKYKERRRETENRIRHTKENLARLNDILEEINKQLKHLKSQANAAERYRKYKQRERLIRAELHVLYWRDLSQKIAKHDQIIKEEETKLENSTTELHVLNSKIATLREQYGADIEKFNEIQEDYYRLGASIARLEQQIQHSKERQNQLYQDLEQVNQSWEETLDHQTVDENQIELLSSEKTELEAKITDSENQLVEAGRKLQEAKAQEDAWQKTWNDFNNESNQVIRTLEVEQAKINHLEQRIAADAQGLEKLKAELANIDVTALSDEVSKGDALLIGLRDKQNSLCIEIEDEQKQIAKVRNNIHNSSDNLNQIRNRLQTLVGRKSSLDALQQAALGKNDEVLSDWLKEHVLAEKPRLAQELEVTAGWETAVETVLGVYLEAVCVDDMSRIIPEIKSLAHGNLTLLTNSQEIAYNSRHNLDLLSDKIKSKIALNGILSGIYVTEDIAQALAFQANLGKDESIITKSGIWLGASWLRVAYDNNPKIGTLRREKELHELERNIDQFQLESDIKERELIEQKNSLMVLEEEYRRLQQQSHSLMTEYSEAQSKVASKKTYLEHFEERAIVLKKEIENQEQSLTSLKAALTESIKNKEIAVAQKDTNEQKRLDLIVECEEFKRVKLAAEEQNQKIQKEVADIKMRLQLLQNQNDYLVQSLDRASKRLTTLKERQVSINNSLIEVMSPIETIDKELQQELEKRLNVESELVLAKQKTSGIEEELRELDRKHTEFQELNEKLRIHLERMRTEQEGFQARIGDYQDQIEELELSFEEVNQNLIEEANLCEWKEKLDIVNRKIERLGLINLAAIEEFTKLEERKKYLDEQHEDLIKAVHTLEEVISKIDHDTKEKFKEAYNNINEKFQELFPKVFNGGKASLEQTGDNLLDTGIMIMAQPPGKRNTSIYLLSGGEKALTAIALIFSIFHLNPAPFCILDEVDAPLDDINVIRFSNLVKEMSKTIQFIFITHNKITMEIAGQLIGVTMQEPGVSRIVSVDIEAAVSIAGTDK